MTHCSPEARSRSGARPTAPTATAVLALALASGAAQAAAQQAEPEPEHRVVQPWQHVGDTLAGSYGWPGVLLQLSAVAVTPPLVYTADAPVMRYFQRDNPLGPSYADVTYIAGWSAPLAVPVALYAGGLAADDAELASAGAAALQALAVETVVVSTLKWLTDRAGPYPGGDPNRKRATSIWFRDSKDPADFNFNPFDLAGGLRWPSGHTASTTAVVSALFAFYPHELWLPAIGYPVAFAIGIGMLEGDYHWLSDVVAGALVGGGIGWAAGRAFRHAYDAQSTAAAASAMAAPRTSIQLSLTGRGLAACGTF